MSVATNEPRLRVGHMTRQQANRRLVEFEERYRLLDYTVDGWSVWPLIRFEVGRRLVGFRPPASASQPDRKLRPAISDAARLSRAMHRRFLIVTGSNSLQDWTGDAYRDVWFGDLARTLDGVFVIEQLRGREFSQRRRLAETKSDISTTGFDLLLRGLARINETTEIRTAAHEISTLLSRELGLDALPPRWLARIFAHFLWSKRLFGLLLRRVRPEAVLVADSGQQAMVSAAKEQGIATFELQHGITDRHHTAYGFTNNSLPARASMPLPDQLLLYGDHWRDELEVNGFWGENSVVVGSPRIDRYRSRRASKVSSHTPGPIVLSAAGLDDEATYEFLVETLMELRRRDVKIVVKLHPIYTGRENGALAALLRDARVQVLAPTEGPSTLELLSSAALHVSVSSACHYDALGLRVPTIILPLPSNEPVLHLVDDNHAHIVQSTCDLAMILEDVREVPVPSAEASRHYYAEDSLDRLRRAIGAAS